MSDVATSLPPKPAIPKVLHPALFYRRPAQIADWCRRRYGSAFTLWLPPWGDVAIFTDPAEVKSIFANDTVEGGLDGAPALNKFFEILMGPNSMLAIAEAEHARVRRVGLRALNGRPVTDHRGAIEDIAAEEVDRWPVGERMVLEPAMQRFTMAVMIRDVLGVSNPDDERALRELLSAVVNVGKLVQLQIAFPALRRVGPARRWHRVMAETRQLLGDVVARRRALADLDQRTDALSLLISMTDDDGRHLTDEEIIDGVLTLLQAGHESSAAQLTWLLELLLHYPHTMERLTAELREGREEYLEAAIKESLRVHPALPVVLRAATTEVEVGRYRLPAGTVVCIAINGVHHAPEVHDEPLAFRPERFLDGAAPAPNSWVPWGGGRRRCMGQRFAMVEMEAAAATILRRVELRPWRTKPDTPLTKVAVVVPRRGGEVVVTRRLAPTDGDAPAGRAAVPAPEASRSQECPVHSVPGDAGVGTAH